LRLGGSIPAQFDIALEATSELRQIRFVSSGAFRYEQNGSATIAAADAGGAVN